MSRFPSTLLFGVRMVQVFLAPFSISFLHSAIAEHSQAVFCASGKCVLRAIDHINLAILTVPLLAAMITLTLPMLNVMRYCLLRRDCFASRAGTKSNGLRLAFEEAMVVVWLLGGLSIMTAIGVEDRYLAAIGYVETIAFVTSTWLVGCEERPETEGGSITLPQEGVRPSAESFQSGDVVAFSEKGM